jgi:putative Mn2+ efflux pump MntP
VRSLGLLLALGIGLSLDSFRASLGLGATGIPRARRRQVSAAFGVCDGIAPLAGLAIGGHLLRHAGAWLELAAPLALVAYGAWVLWLVRVDGGAGSPTPGRLTVGLPLALSVDNLLAGAVVRGIGLPAVLSSGVLGAASALASAAGFGLAGVALRRFRRCGAMAGGMAVVVVVAVALSPLF